MLCLRALGEMPISRMLVRVYTRHAISECQSIANSGTTRFKHHFSESGVIVLVDGGKNLNHLFCKIPRRRICSSSVTFAKKASPLVNKTRAQPSLIADADVLAVVRPSWADVIAKFGPPTKPFTKQYIDALVQRSRAYRLSSGVPERRSLPDEDARLLQCVCSDLKC